MLSTAYNSHGFAKMYTFYDAGGNLIGILGDMLNSLSSRLNFKMNATGIPVSDYGTKLQNGSFTGFVGMLQRREFEIVAADTTITAQVRDQSICKSSVFINITAPFSEERSGRVFLSFSICLLPNSY